MYRMRVVWLLSLIVSFYFSKAQIQEYFTGNESLTERDWQGETNKFIIVDEKLRSNSEIANDRFYISQKQEKIQSTEWEIYLDVQLRTSSANYIEIYLTSNDSNPSDASEAYFLRIGDTRDQVVFYKKSGTSAVTLIQGEENVTEQTEMWLKVTRDDNGLWELFASYSGAKFYQKIGEVVDETFTTSDYFSIFVRQSTATFFQKHFFDDIYVGDIRIDIKPPEILSSGASTENTVFFTVDEPIKTPDVSQFSWRNTQTPTLVSLDGLECTLTFAENFSNGNHSLVITGLEDLNGNQLDTTIFVEFFQPSKPYFGAIIFTEIYPNSNNSNGLPDSEYIELYNRSQDTLTLEGCKFTRGGTPAIFPEVILFPGDYLIACRNNDQDDFKPFGTVQNLTSFPNLLNAGTTLYLLDSEDQMIDSVSYSDKWYRDASKSGGGWSLERILLDAFPCDDGDNWIGSNHTIGGTPGQINSVKDQQFDFDIPEMAGIEINNDDQEIIVFFSKSINRDFFVLENFEIEDIGISSITVESDNRSCVLKLSQVMEFKRTYQLTIKPLFDCIGNEATEDIIIILAVPEIPTTGDLLFNELLPNPSSDGVSFIEVYNISDKTIELSNLKLARWLNDSRQNFRPISDEKRLLFPNEYIVFGQELEKLTSDYPNAVSSQFYDGNIPTMPNSGGNLVLFNELDEVIDSVEYTDKMHLSLLHNTKGVSLERRSWNSPTLEPSNWGSASASENFATPGYKNSQAVQSVSDGNQFSLLSKTMSPDGDGFEDALTLNWNLDQPEFLLNAYIYDLSGRMVAQILNNYSIPKSGDYSWDGVLKNGAKIPVGNYILYISAFNLDGTSIEKKLAFSVYHAW